MHHALAAGDVELLTQCLVDGWFELVARTDAAFRGELLELVPEAEVDTSAPLSAVLASIDFINGNTRSGSRRLARARKDWPQAAEPRLQAVLLFAELLHSTNKGKFANTARLARELLDLAEDGPFSSQASGTLQSIALRRVWFARMFPDVSTFTSAEVPLLFAPQPTKWVLAPEPSA